MWNNLRARHYSVLALLALVAIETSAIAIDRLVSAESEEAFVIESSFQNNSFIQSFRMADASCAVLPVRINDLVAAHENKSALSTNYAAPSKLITLEDVFGSPSLNNKEKAAVSKSASAEFVAAAGDNDLYSNYLEYSVQPGDSLSNIAEMFGAKTEAIKNVNKLDNKNSIKAGQTIKVPTNANVLSYTVKKGDSLSKIASRFNVSMENLINENNLKSHVLLSNQKIVIPVNNRNGSKIAKVVVAEAAKDDKDLKLIKTDKPVKVADPTKLQMVKLNNNKLPMASAVASAKKADITFDNNDVVKAPATTVAKAVKPEKESVELKINDSTRASVAAVNQIKQEAKAVELPKVNVAKLEISPDDVAEESEEKVAFQYKVAKGDSLSKIASRFNTTVAQIQSDNNMTNDTVKVGQSLKINPNRKLYRVVKKDDSTKSASKEEKTIVNHKVKSGESLSVIAKKYNTTIADIISANNMSNTVVMAGETIKVPTSKSKNYKITKISTKANAQKYSWKAPTKGWISSPYGWRIHPVRKKRSFHAGIDLAAPKGTAIYNVAPGRVIYTGTRGGYGKLVIVSHENGLSTRYAHCSQILVKNGQYVKEGQLIAKVGATGVATGCHLHFEVRKNGKTQNPLSYLAK